MNILELDEAQGLTTEMVQTWAEARANLEHQKAKRLEALAEGDRMRLLVSDLMALFSVSIDHPQAELQLRRRAADAKKGAESWIYDHGERVDWNEDDQIKEPSYADSGRGAVEP